MKIEALSITKVKLTTESMVFTATMDGVNINSRAQGVGSGLTRGGYRVLTSSTKLPDSSPNQEKNKNKKQRHEGKEGGLAKWLGPSLLS